MKWEQEPRTKCGGYTLRLLERRSWFERATGDPGASAHVGEGIEMMICEYCSEPITNIIPEIQFAPLKYHEENELMYWHSDEHLYYEGEAPVLVQKCARCGGPFAQSSPKRI